VARLIGAGVCFILPAMLIVLALAWAYVEYGTRPAATWLLYGVKPVIIVVVFQALYGLARTAIKTLFLAFAGVAVFALYLLGGNEIALLFGAGAVVVAVENGRRIVRRPLLAFGVPFASVACPGAGIVRHGRLVQPTNPLSDLSQDWLRAVRLRLRPARLPAQRFRCPAGLAD
jgi:chromate transport protein ChrA